jgi:signal peptidase I
VAARPPSPRLAAVLSALVIGWGDAYNGNLGKAVGLCVAAAVAGTAVLVVVPGAAPVGTAAVALLGSWLLIAIGFRIYGARRAYADALAARAGGVARGPLRPLGSICALVLVVLLTRVVVRTAIVQAFTIPAESMSPTLDVGDHVLVNKFVYGIRWDVPLTPLVVQLTPALRAPRPGDVIVFQWPKDHAKTFVKRVVAVGGQTVEVRRRQVLVDGQPWDDPHAHHVEGSGATQAEDYGPTTVAPGELFVLGDERERSYDSRFWGGVPLADVRGEVMTIYWSSRDRRPRWDRIGRVVR